MSSDKVKIDGRVKTTKIELPTGGYIKVHKDGKFYTVKTFKFDVVIKNANDLLKSEAEAKVQEIIVMSQRLEEQAKRVVLDALHEIEYEKVVEQDKKITFVGVRNCEDNFLMLEIEDGNSYDSVGDQIWISRDGTEMQLYLDMDLSVFNSAVEMFEGKSEIAFKGAMRRYGYLGAE